jgi:hypothetical protein
MQVVSSIGDLDDGDISNNIGAVMLHIILQVVMLKKRMNWVQNTF